MVGVLGGAIAAPVIMMTFAILRRRAVARARIMRRLQQIA
jgi:hypothetical protein